MVDFTNYGTKDNFNDPSTSLGNMIKGLTLRFWSLSYMKKASEEIVFKAFITDFADEFASSWSEDTVYGRQDPLAVFQNTVRTITMGLDIPAANIQEGKNNLSKMQQLIKGVYPVYESYEKVPVLQSAPLWKIKLSNLITAVSSANASAKTGGLTCKINGITYSPDLEPGMFVENGSFYPKNIKLNFTCTVFHNHTVGFDSNKQFLTKNGLNYPYGAFSTKDITEAGAMIEEFITTGATSLATQVTEEASRMAGVVENVLSMGKAIDDQKKQLKQPNKTIKNSLKKRADKNMRKNK